MADVGHYTFSISNHDTSCSIGFHHEGGEPRARLAFGVDGVLRFEGEADEAAHQFLEALQKQFANLRQDVVDGFKIEIEKLLCEKLGKSWRPEVSIASLVDELAANGGARHG